MKRKLYLLTETFPYGVGEKTFIFPELEELVKKFDVTIISHAARPVYQDKKNRTDLSAEIKVVNLPIELKWYKRVLYGLRFLFDRDGRQEIRKILKSREDIVQRIYQSMGFFGLALENYRLMEKNGLLSKETGIIYYTYWYFYYTYSIVRYKRKSAGIKLITRAHGFDLYAERYKGNRQPFKEIMDCGIDKIFFISANGKEYYLNKYNWKNSSKYEIRRLGTVETEKSKKNYALSSGKVFRLVSCSSVIPLKRVDLIVKALSLIEEPIEWIHFGDGIEYDHITKLADRLLADKPWISFYLKGYVSNDKVIKYYQENAVDCFISTSSTEGLPVSIQEAMSFGIPIIATNVGGVKELVEKNGILLSANPSIQEVAEAILKISKMPEYMRDSMRLVSRKLWEKDYDAVQNSKVFVEELLSI